MAWWGLTPIVVGKPVYQLLGGVFRPRAPFVAYEYTVGPKEGKTNQNVSVEMADKVERAITETGTKYFEPKIGVYTVDCDITTIHEVRKSQSSSIEIGIDANMVYSFEEASRFIDAVRDSNLANVEEPVS